MYSMLLGFLLLLTNSFISSLLQLSLTLLSGEIIGTKISSFLGGKLRLLRLGVIGNEISNKRNASYIPDKG